MPFIVGSIVAFTVLLFYIIKNINVNLRNKIKRRTLAILWTVIGLVTLLFLFRIGAPIIGIAASALFFITTFIDKIIPIYRRSIRQKKNTCDVSAADGTVKEIMTISEAADIMGIADQGIANVTEEKLEVIYQKLTNSIESGYLQERIRLARDILKRDILKRR